jgi:hypothetical protein
MTPRCSFASYHLGEPCTLEEGHLGPHVLENNEVPIRSAVAKCRAACEEDLFVHDGKDRISLPHRAFVVRDPHGFFRSLARESVAFRHFIDAKYEAKAEAFTALVKRRLREWPLCPFSGKPWELSLQCWPDETVAYWRCPSCGA